MKFIAHRGNIVFPINVTEIENHPSYLEVAIRLGYDVEVDVRKYPENDQLYFGHDEPTHKVDHAWILEHIDYCWFHAKNFDALQYMIDNFDANVFYHGDDAYTLTSKKWIWAYPGFPGGPSTIAVLPEQSPNLDISTFGGICSDNIEMYKRKCSS